MAAEATAGVGGGFNAFYWHQIFALDSVVVKTQKLLSSHGGFLTNAMHHDRETSNQMKQRKGLMTPRYSELKKTLS